MVPQTGSALCLNVNFGVRALLVLASSFLLRPAMFASSLQTPLHVEMSEQQQREEACAETTALDRARALQVPQPKLQYGGEYEHGDFWEENENLIKRAREEWGKKHPELYDPSEKFAERFMDEQLVAAFKGRDKDTLLNEVVKPTCVPGVYSLRLFKPEFTELLLDELDHHESSGIPRRRPNGMNRYGSILSELGFSSMINSLVENYLVHVARQLFGEYVGPNDLEENYAFTVRYQPGEDVNLAEHTDASTVTINICLQPTIAPSADTGDNQRVLYFKERRILDRRKKNDLEALPNSDNDNINKNKNATYVELSLPGYALIHLGQHVHGVSTLPGSAHDDDDDDVNNRENNPRSQLVVWLFGKDGYVRVAPYEPAELKAHERLYDSFWRSNKKSRGAKVAAGAKRDAASSLKEDDEL